ncbi:unnamed protein product, partial [Medioppia subpectinata]
FKLHVIYGDRFPDLSVVESLSLADSLKCGICLNVLDKAVDTRCGHTFCHECLNQWLSRPQTTKECPECRQPLASRKRSRSQSTDANEVIIGGNVLVGKNRRINEMIGKLKIRCEYEWNGCPEVCPLESLSTHLKTCQHKWCQTCGLSVGLVRDDHNCIEGLKRDRNEWTQRAQEFEIRLKESNEMALNLEKKYNSQQNEWQTKCNEWIEKDKGFDIQTKEMETKIKELETKLQESEEKVQNLKKLCTEMHGLHKDFQDLERSVKTSPVVAKQIHCLYACVDSSLPLLCIKPNNNRGFVVDANYCSITDLINDCRFDVNSIDSSERFIIIELREVLSETFVSQLCEKCVDNNNFEFKTIGPNCGQLMIRQAVNAIM